MGQLSYNSALLCKMHHISRKKLNPIGTRYLQPAHGATPTSKKKKKSVHNSANHHNALSLLPGDGNAHAALCNNARWGVKDNGDSQGTEPPLQYEQWHVTKDSSAVPLTANVRGQQPTPATGFVLMMLLINVSVCVQRPVR